MVFAAATKMTNARTKYAKENGTMASTADADAKTRYAEANMGTAASNHSNAKARSAEASVNVANKKANSDDGFVTAKTLSTSAFVRRSGLVVQKAE